MGIRDNIRKSVRNWQNRRDSERLINQMRKTAGSIGHRVSNQRESYSNANDKFKLANLRWYNDVIPRDKTRNKEHVEMLRYIRDLSPDISLAAWNVLRIGNNGHTVEVTKPTGSADKRGQAYIDDLAARINTDQHVNVQLLSAYTNGAIAEEWEIADNLRDVVNVHPIQPSTIDFRINPETQDKEMVQVQDNGQYKVLNPEKVFYIPLDPDIGDPYGRSPLTPIMQAVFFQVEVLRDLQKVAHNQGHARFDIKVIEESIINNIPPQIKQQGPKAITAFVNEQIAQIQAGFTGLEPDDNFFHTDSVEVNTAGGTAGKSMDFKPLIEVIDRQIISATKQVDIIMGRNAGSTETHTTIQWEIFVNGIESMRRMIKRSLERGYNLALRLQGSTSTAKVTFNEIRTTDRKSDAESEQLEMSNLVYQVQQGWISNDDAALKHTGHKAVAEPQTITVSVPQQQEDEDVDTPSARFRKRVDARKKLKARESVRAVITTDPDELAEYEPDPFVLDIEDEYAEQLARFTTAAKPDVMEALSTNRDNIVERLRNNADKFSNVVKSYYSKRFVYAAEETSEEELQQELEEALVSDADAEDWITILTELVLGAATVSGVIIADVITKDTGKEYTFNPDGEDLVTALMAQANDAGIEIADTSVQKAINVIIKDIMSGDFDIDRTIQNLVDDYGFSEARAEFIAVNEILSAGRAGQYYSELNSGVVEVKVWHGIRDKRQRPAHGAAEGQTKLMNEPFEVMGELLMYPGDRSLGATIKNTARCRCNYTRIYAQ